MAIPMAEQMPIPTVIGPEIRVFDLDVLRRSTYKKNEKKKCSTKTG